MGHAPARHRDPIGDGAPLDVPLDRLPDEEQLPAAEGAEVVGPFQQDGVLEPVPDGPDVVVDTFGQLLGGKVRFAH